VSLFIVGLGANLGAREAAFRAAIDLMERDGRVEVEARSRLYDTAPVGPPQPRYLNGAVRLATRLDPDALFERLLEIERLLGRDRTREERWGPRSLDLDLLWTSIGEVRTPLLEVPHPRLLERAFALAPLLDVAPAEVVASLAPRLRALGGPPPVHDADRTTRTRVQEGEELCFEAIAADAAEALAEACSIDPSEPRAPSSRVVHLTSDAGVEGLAPELDAWLARGHLVRWLAVPRFDARAVRAVAHVGPPGERPRRVRALSLESHPRGFSARLILVDASSG